MANANRLQMSETPYKFEWLEPEKWENLLKGAASVASLVEKLAKLKQAFSKGRSPKRDLKKLGNEIDELRKDLETVLGVLTKSISSNAKSVNALGQLVTVLGDGRLATALSTGLANVKKLVVIVISHDDRLKTLEASVGAGKSKSGRKGKRNS
jgi:hypothetical protein